MFVQPIRLTAKPFLVLDQQSRPQVGQPEVVPWYLFDRLAHVNASTLRLDYFNTVHGDKSLGNIELQSQLSTPQFMEVMSLHFDLLARITNKADADPPTGALDDTEQLRRSGRGRWTFKMSSKSLSDLPLTLLNPPGNPVGLVAGMDNVAAGGTPSSLQLAGWMAGYGTPDPIFTIPPTTSFQFFVEWPALLTLATDNQLCEAGFWGPLHRKVV